MNLSKLSTKINPSIISQIELLDSKFNCTTPLRLAHFLSQCSHESANFTLVKENLNYSAKGLLSVFHKYFPTEALAKAYERQPQKIANKVYGNRMGNGDEASGEGFKFSGKGFIQLTGKDNYKAFSTFIGEDCVANPDLVATKYPLASACWFFNRNNLWTICDGGSTLDVVKKVTRRVNGGEIGLDDRWSKFQTYISLIN
jgi:putative chitinase